MVQEFSFEHFLKLDKPEATFALKNQQLIKNKESVTIGFDDDELSNINSEVLNNLRSIVPEIKFKTCG